MGAEAYQRTPPQYTNCEPLAVFTEVVAYGQMPLLRSQAVLVTRAAAGMAVVAYKAIPAATARIAFFTLMLRMFFNH